MKKTIKLIDLDCGHCADKIQNAVKKIDGVTGCNRQGVIKAIHRLPSLVAGVFMKGELNL